MSSEVFNSAAFLAAVTGKPGVYRMFDAAGELLYCYNIFLFFFSFF